MKGSPSSRASDKVGSSLVLKANSVSFATDSIQTDKLVFKDEWKEFQIALNALYEAICPNQPAPRLLSTGAAQRSFMRAFTTPHVDEKAFQSALLGALRDALDEAYSHTKSDMPLPQPTNDADNTEQPLQASQMVTGPLTRKRERESEKEQPTKRIAAGIEKSKQTAHYVTRSVSSQPSSTYDSMQTDGKVRSSPMFAQSLTMASMRGGTEPHSAQNVATQKECNEIWLKHLNVGFTTELNRQSQGFPAKYGWGERSRSDLACIVSSTRRKGIDTVAVVELKVQNKSCETLEAKSIPSLKDRHAPLSQALFYTMDSWHCVARRGAVSGTRDIGGTFAALPVVVLAAKKEGETELPNRLCCMQASLKIPEHLGGMFRCEIERCIKFPSDGKELKNSYMQAISVFVRTMCFGLRVALEMQNKSSPTTLCCFPSPPNLSLVACPVPSANDVDTRFKITQGELHAVTGKSVELGPWIRGLKGSFAFFTDDASTMDDCIVKVSCKTVHDYFVFPGDSWDAISHLSHYGSHSLKAEMAKVLLAGAKKGPCIALAMKDLSKSQGTSSKQKKFGTRFERWQAFSRLVQKVLLPMADENVVHTDVRFSPKDWKICNVLSFWDVTLNSREFALIDFESLVVYNEGGDEKQEYAISLGHLGSSGTAYLFLFWQVLWVAYGWWETSVKVDASIFVENFFNVAYLVSVKAKIGSARTKLLEKCKDTLSRDGVKPETASKTFQDILSYLESLLN
jgi:hypothetical protein